MNSSEPVKSLICVPSHTHSLTLTLSHSLLCRSWPWSTSTVTSVWTRPARRTARCPASETAHTHAPNSGYSATSHYQRSSDHTPHTHKHTHSHTQRPRVSNRGNRLFIKNWAPGKERLPMKGMRDERRWDWTVLPLPEIRGRRVFDPPRSEQRRRTLSRRTWLLLYVCFLFLKRF